MFSAILCPSLPEPLHGIYNFSEDGMTVNTTANIVCHEGFHLNGSQYEDIICQGNGNSAIGSWSGNLPICIRKKALYCFDFGLFS